MREFKKGDLVRIREWDDMKREFGLNLRGSIKCRCSFVSGMKYLCGREFVIKKDPSKSGYICGIEGYNISTDMVTLVNDTEIIESDGICNFFGNMEVS